ncbi:MAG: hypothetical protein SGI88_20270 [Candidatus Hydrogenedentes bacterium]|nr:hypothetical protein [Candidatus Hydrogenedentota bacterium]
MVDAFPPQVCSLPVNPEPIFLNAASPRTLYEMPRPARSFWLALGILVAVRLVFVFGAELFTTVPNGDADTFVYFNKEIDYRTGLAESPKVLLLGSSRTQFVLGPAFAKALNVPEQDAGSFGFAASTAWTHLLFLKRNPALLQHCKLIVFEWTPGSYYRVKEMEGRTRTLFSRYASAAERWKLPTAPLRVLAFADLVFPFTSHRNNPIGWRVFCQQFGMDKDARHREYKTPGTATYSIARLPKLPGWTDEKIMRATAPPPEPFIPAKDATDEILRIVPADCKILFWIPPLRPDFLDAVHSTPSLEESFESFREVLLSLEDSRVNLAWYDDPNATVFRNRDFVDPVHNTMDVILRELTGEAARVARIELDEARGQ